MHFLGTLFGIMSALISFGTAHGMSAVTDDKLCLAIRTAITGNDFVTRDLTQDVSISLPCLEDFIGSLATFHDKDSAISTMQNEMFLQSTRKSALAIRASIDQNGASAVEVFRANQTIPVISALTLAAISNDRDTRQSATLVLGNVIDETTICVPEDYLYYDQITDNGRANLLAIISIPLAYVSKQEYANIQRLIEKFDPTKYSKLFDTSRILQGIQDKAKSLEPQASPIYSTRFKALCGQYAPLFAPRGMLVYPDSQR